MKADRALSIDRMVELGQVSRSGFYRFEKGKPPRPDDDMELRDAIQRIALGRRCFPVGPEARV